MKEEAQQVIKSCILGIEQVITLYLLFRLLPVLPAGNIHRVINEKLSSGSIASIPLTIGSEVCLELFPVDEPDNLFTVRSIYFTTK